MGEKHVNSHEQHIVKFSQGSMILNNILIKNINDNHPLQMSNQTESLIWSLPKKPVIYLVTVHAGQFDADNPEMWVSCRMTPSCGSQRLLQACSFSFQS